MAEMNSTEPSRTSRFVFVQLVVMMLLQYFVQGCYLPIAGVYVDKSLRFSATQIGLFGALLAVGPLFAPFIIGQLVDRLFATQKVLAFCHLAGGALMLALYWQGNALMGVLAASSDSTEAIQRYTFIVMALATLYSILYVPSMMLTNAMAFHHLRDKDREFPWVRLFGTVGFVIPAYLIEFWWLRGLEDEALNQARGIAFAFAGIGGIAMGVYSLVLPHTPPKQEEKTTYAPGIVIGMLRQRHFLVLVLITFVIAIVHKFFFVWNASFLREILDSGGIKGAFEQSISSIGQIFEVVVMACLGFYIKRFGFKFVMLTGGLAYTLRCVLFGLIFQVDPAFSTKMVMACTGQALHGLCFGCFLAAGYMYVDRICSEDVRGSMQTLYGTFVISLGFFVGGFVGGFVGEKNTPKHELTVTVPVQVSIDVSLRQLRDAAPVDAQQPGSQAAVEVARKLPAFEAAKELRLDDSQQGRFDALVAERIDELRDQLADELEPTDTTRDWSSIWMFCAGLAALATIAFAVLFPGDAGLAAAAADESQPAE